MESRDGYHKGHGIDELHDLFGDEVNVIVTLTLAHITFCIPYVILSVMPKLRQLDDNVAEAALDLGATPWQALTKVIIPQVYPAIFSGAW